MKNALRQSWYLLFILFSISFSHHAYSMIADKDFEQCKVNLAQRANLEGFSAEITHSVIPQLKPVKRVLILDKKQPEFSESFQSYLSKRVNSAVMNTGKKKLIQHKALLHRLEIKYGVPAHYLVSFWGLETHYGKHKGKMSVLNSLATLACDARRSEFFTQELLAIFTLLEQKKVTKNQLKGSWAGAMGHLQFMPSALLKYATDGDNDGVVNIWESEADALTTAANYLKSIGWQYSETWGETVTLPDDFLFEKINYDQEFPLLTFQKLGIKYNTNLMPNSNVSAQLYLPGGHQGPAFLLYPNFNVIMTWNLSKSYALSVGILADILAGNNVSILNLAKDKQIIPYRNIEMKTLQEQLNALNFNTGEPDGIWGPNTRRAIRAFQIEQKLIADGYPNPEVFKAAKSAVDIKSGLLLQ